MRRLSWLAALLLWLGAAAPASAVPTLAEQNFAPAQAQRMNIVLITADDLGKSLGTYGDPLAQTPHLDALAARGVLFERAWVTQASCSSSRASMLTGLYPHQHGQIGLAGQHAEFSLRRGLTTLPGLLRAAGYFNGIIGKLHIDPPDAFPFDRRWNADNGAMESRDVRRVASVARDFLRQRGSRPFFLYVNYFDPHRPYSSESDQFLGLPAAPYTAEDVTPLPFLGIDSPLIRSEVASYYNGISRLDTGVGLLLQELARAGVLERTVVVFVSDHGAPEPVTDDERGRTYSTRPACEGIACWYTSVTTRSAPGSKRRRRMSIRRKPRFCLHAARCRGRRSPASSFPSRWRARR